MLLAHQIALAPTVEQAQHFLRACGVVRYAYNGALAEWKKQYDAKEKPSVNKIKIKWNAHRKANLPWTYDVIKCAGAQAMLNLGVAFSNFFRNLKKPKGRRRARYPRFKTRGQRDSFALWNDQFSVDGPRIRVSNLGWVTMEEPLRLSSKIMAGTVSRIADRAKNLEQLVGPARSEPLLDSPIATLGEITALAA
jgi:putative transposase